MNIDISKFNKSNIIDTCSIWNIISSNTFFGCINHVIDEFVVTNYVIYEALVKPRKSKSEKEQQLIDKLKKLIELKKFNPISITIEDLQDANVFENRKNFGKGEISSIIFAKKTLLSFLTDDQKARNLANEILDKDKVQTTPHLLGWLFYNGLLLDSDFNEIVSEHNSFNRPLEKYFNEVYFEAMRFRLISQSK